MPPGADGVAVAGSVPAVAMTAATTAAAIVSAVLRGRLTVDLISSLL